MAGYSYGTLYLVPTPIGNLEDMTLRGIDILKTVSLIGAEDSRKSATLLSRYEIKTPTISYHKFNENSRIASFLTILKEGKDIAIITDAGTPGISDPAEIIIKAAIESGIRICTLPGASALLPALVSSGFNCKHFAFLGFLPSQESEKRELLQRVSSYPETLIFYESGKRLHRFLKTIREFFGNRNIVIGREISKIYETYYRDCLDRILDDKDSLVLKGEFTIVSEGSRKKEISDEEIIKLLRHTLSEGKALSQAVNQTSKALNIPKNRTYKIALKITKTD